MTWRSLRSGNWRQLAPVVALVIVLVALGAVVVFGAVGPGPDRAAQPPSPSDSTMPPPGSPGTPGTPSTTSAPASASPPSETTSPGAPTTLNPSSIPSLPGCLAPRRLNVLTFNIHGALDGRRRVRLDRIAAEIAASKADVVLLQEIDRFRARTGYRDEPTILADLLHMAPAFGANVVRPTRAPGHATSEYGTAILSRFPIISSSNTHLPNRPGLEQRGVLDVAISVTGQVVHVFDTHLQHTSESMRVVQIRAVRALVEQARGPVLLGGDFNSRPDGQVLTVARSFLHDTWPEIGDGPGYTHGQHHPRVRIDYLLHNDWLTPAAAQVLPSAVSDHRSLWAAYDLWSRPGCGTSAA